MVLQLLICISNAAGDLLNEGLDMAADNEQTFCLGFSSQRASNQYVVLAAAEQHRHKKKNWVFKWWLMIMEPPHPHPHTPSWRTKDLQRGIFEGSPSKPRLASAAASWDFCY